MCSTHISHYRVTLFTPTLTLCVLCTSRGGLSKIFARPKGKDDGAGSTSDPDTPASPDNMQQHKSPRRQTTPKKKVEFPAEDMRGSVTPESLKRVPPKVKNKPKPVKSKSVDFGMEGKPPEEDWVNLEGEGGRAGGEVEEKKKRPVGGVAAMPLVGLSGIQLTSVLKPKPQAQPRNKVSCREVYSVPGTPGCV